MVNHGMHKGLTGCHLVELIRYIDTPIEKINPYLFLWAERKPKNWSRQRFNVSMSRFARTKRETQRFFLLRWNSEMWNANEISYVPT
jgi:hypothetical protein